jgi:transposase
VFRCNEAVAHHAAPTRAAPTRAASVVREVRGGHRPELWRSDRYSAQQGHGLAQQTCLAHLARDVASAVEASDGPAPFRIKLRLASAFAWADRITHLTAAPLAAKRRALERRLTGLLASPTSCDRARERQGKLRRARDPLLTFVDRPGEAEATNTACERDLRPRVIQRKVTNSCRAMGAAKGEADVRAVLDTARLTPRTGVLGTILHTVTA